MRCRALESKALFFLRKGVVMAVKEAMEPKPLVKRAALEYLEKQGQATAKELAIDRDSRAATASELLERCSSQGLVERDEKERPRVYRLTGPGRDRLEFFRSQDAPQVVPSKPSNPSSKNPSANNPRPGGHDEPEHEAVDVESIKLEVRLQFQNLREDMRDFLEVLGFCPSHAEELSDEPSQVEKLRGRLESLAEKSKEALADEALLNFYQVHHAFVDPESALGGEVPTEEEVADLRGQVGKEGVGKIEQLVKLESELDSARYREALRLRHELNLPVEVPRKEKVPWFKRAGR
jgi:DNA-binding MarR family transcriptional regulator